MAVDSMMQFRLSYLRLVAWAWEDMANNYPALLAVPDLIAYFPTRGLIAPDWTIKVTLDRPTVRLAASGFDPANTGGWIGPKAELTIEFPRAPANAADWPAAMTAYYAKLPTPFGEKPPPVPQAGVASGSGGHGMGHMSDALVLGGVIVRALAISWSDAAFRAELFRPGIPINGVLEDYLGYNLPWNMNLFGRDTQPQFLQGPPGLGDWAVDPRNELKMFVPEAPVGAGNAAVALAAYNQTGDQYPLTCP